MARRHIDRCPWDVEADAIEFDADDFESAEAADLPEGQEQFGVVAQEDEFFEQQFDEWFEYLFGNNLLALGLEQSCHDGVLLPWDMRGVRLTGIPDDALAMLRFFFKHCPKHVVAHLAVRCYWAVRLERVRRSGRPDWSCRDPLPPATEPRAFFRPSALTFRRQL